MLGVNQGIIMVLAVVVIGGLVGSPGLGYEVAQGIGRSDFGLGVLASLAILALGIALDRVTRGARRSQTIGVTLTSVERRAADGRPLPGNQSQGGSDVPKEMVEALGVRRAGDRGRERVRRFGERARRRQREERACGTVTMDENAWAGATANVYVLKYVLEKNLGCKVNVEKLPESTPLFQAMADGKVDVVPEDWNNIDLKVNKKYVSSGTILRLGSNGVIGHIGWYIPTYLMKQYPQFKTWQGLKGKEIDLQEPGVRLAGDVPRRRPDVRAEGPAADQALGLDLKFVSVGSEPTQVSRWTQAYKQKKPILFYWYTPQYLNKAYQLSEIKLPPRAKDCVRTATTRSSAATWTSTSARTARRSSTS